MIFKRYQARTNGNEWGSFVLPLMLVSFEGVGADVLLTTAYRQLDRYLKDVGRRYEWSRNN